MCVKPSPGSKFACPKSTKIYNNKNYIIYQPCVPAREVSQKSFLTFPCCMGLVFFLIAMQRGNAISHFCDTSHARTSFFSFFPHVPSEKLKNTENRIMESCCGRVGAKDAKCKSSQKSIPAPKDTIGTHFLHKHEFNNSIHNC